MKKNLTKIFTTLTVAAILAVGVSYVSAYSPSMPVPGIFTTKNDDQTKQGGIMSEKFMASDLGFFTKLLAPGPDSWLNIGGPFNGNDPQGITNSGGLSPLTIHLNGVKRPIETKSGISGIVGTKFIADAGACATPITWVNDRASSFDFISTSNSGGYADLIAGQVRFDGGTPQDGSVLAAIDNQGNAVWAKLEIRNGEVVVIENQTGSPVSTDASCTLPPPPTCPTGTTGTPPNCVEIVNNDLCRNISGDQTDRGPHCQSTLGTIDGVTGQGCLGNIGLDSNALLETDRICKYYDTIDASKFEFGRLEGYVNAISYTYENRAFIGPSFADNNGTYAKYKGFSTPRNGKFFANPDSSLTCSISKLYTSGNGGEVSCVDPLGLKNTVKYICPETMNAYSTRPYNASGWDEVVFQDVTKAVGPIEITPGKQIYCNIRTEVVEDYYHFKPFQAPWVN